MDFQPRIVLKTKQVLSNFPTEVQGLIYQKAHDSFVQEFLDIQEALELSVIQEKPYCIPISLLNQENVPANALT